MRVQWTFKNCDDCREQATAYWSQKQQCLERPLTRIPGDQPQLNLALVRHHNRDAWELRANLKLGAQTLVAGDVNSQLSGAIDQVVTELAEKIRHRQEGLRSDYRRRRREQHREDMKNAEQHWFQEIPTEPRALFRLLKPHLRSIADYAHRELQLMEIEEVIPRGEWTADDLLDDVLLCAIDRFNNRRPNQPLDVWLLELLHERLDELQQQIKPISLVAPDLATRWGADHDICDEDHWMSPIFSDNGNIRVEELLLDRDMGAFWDKLTAEEQYCRLMEGLGHLSALQRRALMLHGVEGFAPSDIAIVLNLSEARAKQLIDQARKLCVEKLT